MTTLIVTGTPNPDQQEALGRYLHGVQPLLAAAGGTPVKRLRVTDSITGTAGTALVLVMDFDSAETLHAAFGTDEYLALVPDRDKAFSTLEILVTEDAG